uniref:UBC core domain-containing protein n=1 Tax=Panagrellus redivivus TaxID=6233 RepID=A0A7E4VTP9_PANRE
MLKTVSMKRLMKEIEHFKTEPPPYLAEFEVDEKNVRKWTASIHPRFTPFKHGVFKLKIEIHPDYPFKPPRMQFLTPIYHPNVDEKGMFCLSILQMDNWKAGVTVAAVLDSLLYLLERPEPERSLRFEIGEQYALNRAEFIKSAHAKTKALKAATKAA